jgi:hypothetical protein
MRRFVLLMVATFVAALSIFGPAQSVVQAAASDILPKESDLATAFAPFAPLKVAPGVMSGPGNDGWDVGQLMQVEGGPGGAVLVSTDAAELPTAEGAAGFLQTKLQQLRDATKKDNMAGELGPADAKLTGDADEAYFGVFVSPPGAPDPIAMAVLVSRYDNQVAAVTAMIKAGPGGTVSEDAQKTLGIVLGVMAGQINSLASD